MSNQVTFNKQGAHETNHENVSSMQQSNPFSLMASKVLLFIGVGLPEQQLSSTLLYIREWRSQ